MSIDSSTNIPALLDRALAHGGDRLAVTFCRDGRWIEKSWQQLAGDAAHLTAALRDAGIDRGDRVAQVSANRYEWIVADLAILSIGAVHVPIHATLAPPQIAFQIVDSGSRLVLIEGRTQADALRDCLLDRNAASLPERAPQTPSPLRGEGRGEGVQPSEESHSAIEGAPLAAADPPPTPSLKGRGIDADAALQVIAYDDWPERATHPLNIVHLADLLDRVTCPDPAALLASASETIAPDDLATVLYTSGTTGQPRGVMLTHGNLASNAIATAKCYDGGEEELRLGFLPLSHVYARTCDLYVWLHQASRFALATSRETVLADCATIRPTAINGVPYFYDRLIRGLHAAGKADQPGALLHMLGGRIRHCFCGGAALPEHVARAFEAQGVRLLPGYGLSESSPVITASRPDAHRFGAVGRAVPGVEVRIAADGEILTRGPHVMAGYWNRPDDTREAIRDGWLHTGDLGHLDEDGFLFIRGRKKEILVTAAGKNVVPSHLEGLIAQSPLVALSMVVGEGRSCLGALIVPDADGLRAAIAREKIAVTSPAEALHHSDVLALYRQELDRLLAEVSHHEQVRRFVLLERGFTIEQGELTAKLSLRREVIAEHFADRIEAMYAASDDDTPSA